MVSTDTNECGRHTAYAVQLCANIVRHVDLFRSTVADVQAVQLIRSINDVGAAPRGGNGTKFRCLLLGTVICSRLKLFAEVLDRLPKLRVASMSETHRTKPGAARTNVDIFGAVLLLQRLREQLETDWVADDVGQFRLALDDLQLKVSKRLATIVGEHVQERGFLDLNHAG